MDGSAIKGIDSIDLVVINLYPFAEVVSKGMEFSVCVENIDIGSGYADDLLVSAAEEGYLIATNDIEILNKLKSKRINALRIREKTKLIHTEVDS